jgi:hypothetical protein
MTLTAALTLAMAAMTLAQRGEPQRGNPPPQQAAANQARPWGETGITIFSEANFHGMNANFRDDVPDLRRYNMNDRVDGLALGRGETWEVCEHINYGGRCQVFSGDETDLAKIGWGGMISSLRRVRGDTKAYGWGRGGSASREYYQGKAPYYYEPPRLVLYDHIWFSGESYVVTGPQGSLRALNNRAGSVKAYGGPWELCDGPNFTGKCVTIEGSQQDLGRVLLRDRVSSARPIPPRR